MPEVFLPAATAHFIECAERIVERLERGIAGENGVLLMKGQRLRRPGAEVYLKRDEANVGRTFRCDV